MFGRKQKPAPEPAATAPATPRLKSVPAPVTRAEFDTMVGVLAVILAQVERAAAAPPGHVQARLGYRLERVARAPDDFGLSAPQAAAFKRIAGLIDRAADNDMDADRNRAAERGNGGRAFHF